MSRILKESFNAGEFSPRLHSRYELAKYKNGCKTLTNFVPLAHGPVTRRPGTEYIAEVKTSSKYTRLIPFVFSEEDSYVIEFGDLYVRFYKNGGQIWTADANTDLLLHFDGDNNSTTITDSGDTGHSPAVVANAKLKTLNKKFGTAALYLDDSDDYISVADNADWNLGSGEFTIDCWFYKPEGATANTALFLQSDDPFDSDEYYSAWYNDSAEELWFIVRTGASYTIQALLPIPEALMMTHGHTLRLYGAGVVIRTLWRVR